MIGNALSRWKYKDIKVLQSKKHQDDCYTSEKVHLFKYKEKNDSISTSFKHVKHKSNVSRYT